MKKVIVNQDKCIRCGACMYAAPEVFGCGENGESVALVEFVEDDNKDAIMAMEGCPTGAITLEETAETEKQDCHCESCDCGDECHCEEECDCHSCHEEA